MYFYYLFYFNKIFYIGIKRYVKRDNLMEH